MSMNSERLKRTMGLVGSGLAELKTLTDRALERPEDKEPEPEGRTDMDPESKPTTGIVLRLNEYQMEILRYVADADGRSMQKTLKRIVIPELEDRARRIEEEEE